jgi:tight adherence protein C
MPDRRRAHWAVWLVAWCLLGFWLVWVVTGNVLLAIVGGGVGCTAAIGTTRRRQRASQLRRASAMTAGLPDVLELLAATVDGGAAPDLAIVRVAAFAPEPLRGVLVDATRNATVTGLGQSLRAADPALRALGSLLQQSEDLGVPISGSLRLLAADARLHARAEARQRAAAAAPKMLLVIGGLLAPAALLIVIGGQALVLRNLIGPVL